MATGISSRFSVQASSQGAGQIRPVNSGKLLVECRSRIACSQFPAIDEVVPFRNLVMDGTARRAMTVGNAAIHAARRLFFALLVRHGEREFAEMPDSVRSRLVLVHLPV